MSPSNPHPAKKQRTFGAPSEDDSLSTRETYNVFSEATSMRDVSSGDVPSLANLCARVFVKHLKHLSEDMALWHPIMEWLKLIPDPMVPKLFAMLRASCPDLLSHGFIIANFLRGSSITLTSDLPGVNRLTIEGVTRAGQTLRELRLVGFEKFSDSIFASIFPKLPFLRVLVLRGCTKVGPKTIEAAAKSCPHLTMVNFGYTAATPASIATLILRCTQLEVLKLAGVQNWTDAMFAKCLSAISQDQLLLPNLRKLKLRQTALSDISVSPLLSLCPNLESLDLSFTLIKHPQKNIDLESNPSFLQKLNLTSTSISGADLLTVLPHFKLLKTLSLGALGSRQGSTLSINNSSAMIMTGDILNSLTDILSDFNHLEHVSLVGNTKLGLTSTHALSRFIQKVGRRCKKLNLASISFLRSHDLVGLLITDGYPSPPALEVLVLNNTGIDDECSPFISSCPDLRSLEVGGTKFTSEGLFPIIDACPKLEKLNLTSCRGVRVRDRRRFFQVWVEENNAGH